MDYINRSKVIFRGSHDNWERTITSFRIESVITNAPRTQSSKLTSNPLSGLVLNFLPPNSYDEGNSFTLILGKNAVGKSQLLSDIAEAFCIGAGEFTSRRRSSLDISMSTIKFGKRAKISWGSNESRVDRSGTSASIPNRVIASATTPFDKFRLSRDVIRERVPYRGEDERKESQYYFYSGLRDSNGRTNFRAAILRTIRGIFLDAPWNPQRLEKMRLVFDFLGLKPAVSVNYSVGSMSWAHNVRDLVFSEQGLDKLTSGDQLDLNSRRLRNFLQENPENEFRLRRALEMMPEQSEHRSIHQFEIEVGRSAGDTVFLDGLFLLKDLRILSFREVNLQRVNGGYPMDILEASSGEISIIAGILGISSGIQDGSLILIDEPEISLHPEWQDRYLDLLRETFSAFRGCHFVIATHSPIILSGAREEDTTILNISHVLKGINSDDYRRMRSFDEIVATQFGIADDDNLFVKQEVMKAANAIARGEIRAPDFERRVKQLSELEGSLDSGSKLAKVIREIIEIANK